MLDLQQTAWPLKFRVLKFICLAIGCLAKFVTGSLFVFNVYQEEIKTTFNFTQKEIELQSSLMNLGLGVGIIPGILYDKFGPTWTSATGMVISVGAYLLLWSTPKFPEFYGRNSWLMAVYFFLSGIGSVFTYMVALNTNVINFESKHRGLIVGILNTFFCGSPAAFSLVYYKGLNEEKKFADFMLIFAVCFAFVDILCIVFIRIYPSQQQNEATFLISSEAAGEENSPSNSEISYQSQNLKDDKDAENANFNFFHATRDSQNDSIKNGPAVSSSECKETLTFKHLLLHVDYHLFTWMFVLAASVGLTFVNNITVIARSLQLDQYNGSLVLIVPISGAAVGILIGLLSDLCRDNVPRITILIGSCICLVISQIIILLFGNMYALLILGTLMFGLGSAALWSLCPAVMSEHFNLHNLGRNWGIAIFLAALVGLLTQVLFGVVYDAHAIDGSLDCFGMDCVRGGIGISLIAAVLSVLFGVLYKIKTHRQRQYISM